MDASPRYRCAWLALTLLLLSGCAGTRFEAARELDTASAYHRFVIEYPNSKYSDEARQRLDLVRLRNQPTLEAYAAFMRAWPSSPLLPQVRAIVEETAFARARAWGSNEAYTEFLREFSDGALAARAQGNLAYLEARGFGGDPVALARFAEQHPQSDFAAEAARTATSVAARDASTFHTVALSLQVTASTPEPERLARVFAERAAETLGPAGVRVVNAGGSETPTQLVIRHHEGPVETEIDAGGIAERGYVAETALTLEGAGGDPIWARTTRFRPPAPPAADASSLILDTGAAAYWANFFVPVATWNTRAAVRSALPLGEKAKGLATHGSRAFVLLDDGSFRIFDLADPERPWPLSEYRRPRDHKQFSRLRVFGDRVVVFGEDGAEIVSLGPAGPRHVRSFDRGHFGTLNSVEAIGGELVAAGRLGLMALPENEGAAPEILVAREIVGLVTLGGHMIFSDARSVYVTTLALMREGRVESQLDLAPGMRATGLRRSGDRVALLSDKGALWLDVSVPTQPRVVGRIDSSRAGTLDDVTSVGGRVFALGGRGLQLLDPRAGRALDSADVLARGHMATLGRHLVLVGGEWLQVVDATPFSATPFPPAAADTAGSIVAEPAGGDTLPDDQNLWATPVER